MDDIIFHSKSPSKHDDIIKKILRKLTKNNTKYDFNKIQFCEKCYVFYNFQTPFIWV